MLVGEELSLRANDFPPSHVRGSQVQTSCASASACVHVHVHVCVCVRALACVDGAKVGIARISALQGENIFCVI